MSRPKILIIRFSSIGDIVLTTPVIRAVKEQLDAEVHFVTKSVFRQLLEQNPYINRLWTIRYNIKEVTQALRSVNFDYVIDLHKNLRSFLLVRSLGRPSVGFNKMTLEKWLYLIFGINRLNKHHIVDRYFKGLSKLGIQNDGNGLNVFFKDSPPPMAENHDKPTILLVAGGTYITKRLPEHLINSIASSGKYRCIVIGGTDTLDASLDKGSNMVDLRNRLDLAQAANVMKYCDLVVTGDTGLMHMAAAMDKPTVVVWGSTSEDFGFYPYYANHTKSTYASIFNEKINCRPCSKYGRKKCPKRHMKCLNDIGGLEVLAAIDHQLATTG